MGDEVDVLPVNKHKNFLQVDRITLGMRVWHAQSIQNKFTMSLQNLNEHVKNEADFLPGDKPQRFPQSDTTILNVCGQTCPNYPK